MLQPGDKMPEFEYAGDDGKQGRLSDSWREGPAWLLWIRHCGCAFFAEAMAELAVSPPADIARVCILQADAAQTARWCADNAGCSTCVPDPKRTTFAAIGNGHTTFGDISKPSESLEPFNFREPPSSIATVRSATYTAEPVRAISSTRDSSQALRRSNCRF